MDDRSDHSSDVIIVSVDEQVKKRKTLCRRCQRKRNKKQIKIKQKFEVRREITFTRIVLNSKVTEEKSTRNNVEKRQTTAESKDRIVPICNRTKCRGCFSNKANSFKQRTDKKIEEKNTIQVKISNQRSVSERTKHYNSEINRKHDDLRKLLNNKNRRYDDLRILLNNRHCRSSWKNRQVNSNKQKRKDTIIDVEDIDSSEPCYEDVSSDSFGTYIDDDIDALIKRSKEREKKSTTKTQKVIIDKDTVKNIGESTKDNVAGQHSQILVINTEDVSDGPLPELVQNDSVLISKYIQEKTIDVAPHENIHIKYAANKVLNNSNLTYCITNEESQTNNVNVLNDASLYETQCQLQYYNTYLQDYKYPEASEYNYVDSSNVQYIAGYSNHATNENVQQIRTWTTSSENAEHYNTEIDNGILCYDRFPNPGAAKYYCNGNNITINYKDTESFFQFSGGMENV